MVCDVAAGTEICVSYLSAALLCLPADQRKTSQYVCPCAHSCTGRGLLQQSYAFLCQCARCTALEPQLTAIQGACPTCDTAWLACADDYICPHCATPTTPGYDADQVLLSTYRRIREASLLSVRHTCLRGVHAHTTQAQSLLEVGRSIAHDAAVYLPNTNWLMGVWRITSPRVLTPPRAAAHALVPRRGRRAAPPQTAAHGGIERG